MTCDFEDPQMIVHYMYHLNNNDYLPHNKKVKQDIVDYWWGNYWPIEDET